MTGSNRKSTFSETRKKKEVYRRANFSTPSFSTRLFRKERENFKKKNVKLKKKLFFFIGHNFKYKSNLFFHGSSVRNLLTRTPLLSEKKMSFANIPTTALAPYQNSFSQFGATQQNLQQFPQHVSNPPGQTVDYFFNFVSYLSNTTLDLVNSCLGVSSTTYTNTAIIQAYASAFQNILQSINAAVSDKYASNPKWSCPILPFPGYAANNAVNSGTNPLNIGAVLNFSQQAGYTSTASYVAAFYIFYWWLYALYSETVNSSSQVNHYTYDFLINVQVTATDYDTTLKTKSVATWIAESFALFDSIYNGTYVGSNAPFPQYTADGTLAPIFETLLLTVTIATADVTDRIPILYLLSPYDASSSAAGNATGATAINTEGPLSLFVIFLANLYNTLSSISPALNKITTLYDANGHYVFEIAASQMALVLDQVYNYSAQVQSTIVYPSSTGNTALSPLSNQSFFTALTYTTKNARVSSVDLNRINGSLVPTLTRTLQVWTYVQYLATQISVSAYFAGYNTDFKTVITNIIADTTIATEVQTAIASFNDQLDVHYSRWSQNLTNI
jgi:hypothetical protein